MAERPTPPRVDVAPGPRPSPAVFDLAKALAWLLDEEDGDMTAPPTTEAA